MNQVRVSTLGEVGDRDAAVGSRPWALWIVGLAKLQRDELERDASALRKLIGKMQKHEAWKALGVPSFDMLCTTQLRLSSDEVSAVLNARKGQEAWVMLGHASRDEALPAGLTTPPAAELVDADETLAELLAAGVQPEIHEDGLRLRGASKAAPELVERARRHKAAILSLLAARRPPVPLDAGKLWIDALDRLAAEGLIPPELLDECKAARVKFA